MLESQRSKDLADADDILRRLSDYIAANFGVEGALILKHARGHILEQLYNLSIERVSGYTLDSFIKWHDARC